MLGGKNEHNVIEKNILHPDLNLEHDNIPVLNRLSNSLENAGHILPDGILQSDILFRNEDINTEFNVNENLHHENLNMDEDDDDDENVLKKNRKRSKKTGNKSKNKAKSKVNKNDEKTKKQNKIKQQSKTTEIKKFQKRISKKSLEKEIEWENSDSEAEQEEEKEESFEMQEEILKSSKKKKVKTKTANKIIDDKKVEKIQKKILIEKRPSFKDVGKKLISSKVTHEVASLFEVDEEAEMGEEFLEEDDFRRKKKKTPKKLKGHETKEKRRMRFHAEGSEEDESEDSSFSSDNFYYHDIAYEDEDEQMLGKHTEKYKKTYSKRTYKKDFFDVDESSSISSNVPSYIQNEDESLEPEIDFFEVLGSIPDIEDMTYTSSEVTVIEKSQQPVVTPLPEKPIIHHPVMQLDDSSIDIQSEKTFEYELEAETVVSDETTETSTLSDSLDLWELDNLPRYSEDILISGAALKEEDDALKELLEYEEDKPVAVEFFDSDDQSKRDYEDAQLNSTKNFLYTLIDLVVDKCIEQEANTFLLKNLDKLKIMKAIIKRYDLLEQERVICKFVDRKVVENFKKKKLFPHITPDLPANLSNAIAKYEEECAKLDEALIRKKATADLKEEVVERLYDEKDKAEDDDIEKIQHLERLIRKTIIRDGSSKLNELVEMKLAKMRQMRNEISKMRLVIIRQQHLIDYYTKKFSEINDLGNGLLMSDYEYLRIKTESLSKKLEERNKDLKKSIMRFNMDMHAVAHIKGKEKIMKLLIQELTEIYNNYTFEKLELRRALHLQKLKREILRKEIVAVNNRGGLLPRPMLIMDFDNTQQKILEAQERIFKLKEIAAEYEEKLRKSF